MGPIFAHIGRSEKKSEKGRFFKKLVLVADNDLPISDEREFSAKTSLPGN